MKKIKWHELCKVITQLSMEHELLDFHVMTIEVDQQERVKELAVVWSSIGAVNLAELERFELSIHMAKKDMEAFNKKYRGYIIEY